MCINDWTEMGYLNLESGTGESAALSSVVHFSVRICAPVSATKHVMGHVGV